MAFPQGTAAYLYAYLSNETGGTSEAHFDDMRIEHERLVPDRERAGKTYRFAFNGKERDTRDFGNTAYDYGFRIYSPAVAKFLSVDPLKSSYPELTPYQFAGNTPIAAIDLDGLEAVIRVTGITKERSTRGQTGHSRGQYFLYQVEIFNDITLDEYTQAYNRGILKNPDETTVLARDAWNSASRSSKRYSSNNEAPPGTYYLNYNKKGFGTKKHKLRLSDEAGGYIISGPEGNRYAIDIHKWSPHDAQGCLTTGCNKSKSETDLIDLVPSLENEDEVRIILEPRQAKWNKEKGKWEGIWDESGIVQRPLFELLKQLPKPKSDNTRIAPQIIIPKQSQGDNNDAIDQSLEIDLGTDEQ